jgi:hypothetical protein
MTLLTIDVETLPGQTEAAREQARADVRPPGSLRKAESIAAWWETEGPDAIEATWRKQALDPAAGELAALGFAAGEDGPALSLVRRLDEPEGEFLRRALAAVDTVLREVSPAVTASGEPWPFPEEVYVIGHNAEFDLGFVRARCWANRIRLPRWIPKPGSRAPRDYGDTMQIFSGYGGRISLDRLCRCLGVPSPKADGTTGADVFDLWQSGQHDALARYNAADVQAARSCWLVMTGHYEGAV